MKKTVFKILTTIVIFSIIVLSCASCAPNKPYSEGNGELSVLCTVFAPFDFVRIIGGERVSVSLLQDSGADMHSYTPTSETLEAISEADLFIHIGGTSDEAWVENAVSAAGNHDLTVLCLMDNIYPVYAELECDWTSHCDEGEHEDHDETIHSEHEHNGHVHGADEHIWTSILNAEVMVNSIKEALCRLDPDGTEFYTQRAEDYVLQLDSLESEYEKFFREASVEIMVFADRFPFVYLMHDYSVPYRAAFSGCSTEINSSFSMQVGLTETVKAHGLPYIVAIEGNDKSLAEAIAAETGCNIVELNSLQSVKRSDIENGVSYIGVMADNLKALMEATP